MGVLDGKKAGEQLGLLVDSVLAEDGGVGGAVVSLGGYGLVVELPEVGHGGHHTVVEAGSEDGVEGFAEHAVGVGLRGGGGDAGGVGGALGFGGGGDGDLELIGFAELGGLGCGWGYGGGGREREFQRFAFFLLLLLLLCRLLFLLGVYDHFAVDGEADDLLLGGDADLVEGGGGVFVGQLLVEVEAVANAFELHFVLGQAHAVDLDNTERVRALGGVADDAAMLVEGDGVAQVAAAEVELLAGQLLLELFFGDGAGLGGAGWGGWLG